MKQIIILITAIIIGATTCNAQGWQGFARRATKAATTTPKVLNKYKTPVITGLAIGATGLSSQRDRQLHTPNARFPRSYLQTTGVPASTVVTRVAEARASHPCATVLSIDSVSSFIQRAMVLPTDTTHIQVQDSITIK